jgi:hypothetical protein
MVTLEDARMRIERAKLMIGSTRKSPCDISAECGFAGQAHLTQCFRRIVGMTPGMWRHRHGFASVGAGESRSRKLGSSEVRSPEPEGLCRHDRVLEPRGFRRAATARAL